MPNPMLTTLADNYLQFSGITERYLKLFTDNDLSWKPREDMRSIRDLIVHLYDGIELVCQSVKTGEIGEKEQEVFTKKLEKFTIEQYIDYSKKVRKLYADTLKHALEEELHKTIHVFYGDFNWGTMLGFVYDEHLHHRGQLVTYIRLMGKEPPFAYDYENNDPV